MVSNFSAIQGRTVVAPSGTEPELMPLAMVTMSGTTFQWSIPNHLPVRPKAVMISSAISTTSYLSQMARTIGQYSSGGTITPPAPKIGSPITAATRRAPPSSRITSSTCLAHWMSHEG